MKDNNKITISELKKLAELAWGKLVISEEEEEYIKQREDLESKEKIEARKKSIGFSSEFLNENKYDYSMPIKGEIVFEGKHIANDTRFDINRLLGSRFTLISGASGVGKSHILNAVALKKFNDGMNIRIFDEERDVHTKTSIELKKMVARYMNVPILYYDDLGFIKLSEENRDIIKGLLAYRIKNNLETFITTNFNVFELLGVAMASRIVGKFLTIKLKGNDRRLEK